MTIKDHEHVYVEVYFMDQKYLTPEEISANGLPPGNWYTYLSCIKDNCTATILNTPEGVPDSKQPIVDYNPYDYSSLH